MKVFLMCLLSFFIGLIVMDFISVYASKVSSYNQLSRSREAMMTAAYKSYQDGKINESAVFARGSNIIANMPDRQWQFSEPFFAASFRFFGLFDEMHVRSNYNNYIIAYLYHICGNNDEAEIYYKNLAKDGVSKEKANHSAKLILDTISKNIK